MRKKSAKGGTEGWNGPSRSGWTPASPTCVHLVRSNPDLPRRTLRKKDPAADSVPGAIPKIQQRSLVLWPGTHPASGFPWRSRISNKDTGATAYCDALPLPFSLHSGSRSPSPGAAAPDLLQCGITCAIPASGSASGSDPDAPASGNRAYDGACRPESGDHDGNGDPSCAS